MKNLSKADRLFLAIFFLMLIFPMLKIDTQEISLRENRSLAKMPALITQTGLNTEFSREFEMWFNDRFLGRNTLITLHDNLEYILSPSQGNENVLVGQDDWLFYRLDNGINNFTNKTIYSAEQLDKGSRFINAIDNWSKKNNKNFVFVIAPDKHKIYGEYYAKIKKINPDSLGLANQFITHLKKTSTASNIYLYETFLKNKDKGLLYYKNDTHWNKFAAYLGYVEIMKALALKPIEISLWREAPHPDGDLSQMYHQNKKKYERINYLTPVLKNAAHCIEKPAYASPYGFMECTNTNAPYKQKVLVLNDSYIKNMKDYLSASFETVTMHRTILKNLDMNSIKNYDIIILETVERYLPLIFEQTFEY